MYTIMVGSFVFGGSSTNFLSTSVLVHPSRVQLYLILPLLGLKANVECSRPPVNSESSVSIKFEENKESMLSGNALSDAPPNRSEPFVSVLSIKKSWPSREGTILYDFVFVMS
ncbi:unnamed protein product [Schistosoma margrebowiei]|uniref:Uncharacterized protein n=1 Tax=Schistosoma margrebowiei TaxID=48269 RepID=A0A3P8GVV0_9TREM|nr:unnamed protein product [Schistosoma margrebowiei]